MRRSRLSVALVLLSLAFVCFISAPVLSVEDPWDVDGGGQGDTSGDSGASPDTTGVSDDPIFRNSDDGGFNPGWLGQLYIDLSYQVTLYFVKGSGSSPLTVQVSAREAGGDDAAK